MSRVHELEDQVPQINPNGKVLERVILHRLLGVWIQEKLKWTNHVTISTHFPALSAIKEIRNMAPKAIKKQLVEALVLSKVDYNGRPFFKSGRLQWSTTRYRSTLKQNYSEFKLPPQVLLTTVMQK